MAMRIAVIRTIAYLFVAGLLPLIGTTSAASANPVNEAVISDIGIKVYVNPANPAAGERFVYTIVAGWTSEDAAFVDIGEIDLENVEIRERTTETAVDYGESSKKTTMTYRYVMSPIAEGECSIAATLIKHDVTGETVPLKLTAYDFRAAAQKRRTWVVYFVAGVTIAAAVVVTSQRHKLRRTLTRPA